MRLSGRSRQPSSGTGTPQSRSLVIARGCRLFSRLRENFSTLGRHSPALLCSQVPSTSVNAGRSRKNCSLSTNIGVSPLIFDLGLIRSIGSSWLPQLSHWSPRALSYPQIGHVPSMYRSGRVRPVEGEIALFEMREKMRSEE